MEKVNTYLCSECGFYSSLWPDPTENGLTYMWKPGEGVTWTEDGFPICPNCGKTLLFPKWIETVIEAIVSADFAELGNSVCLDRLLSSTEFTNATCMLIVNALRGDKEALQQIKKAGHV